MRTDTHPMAVLLGTIAALAAAPCAPSQGPPDPLAAFGGVAQLVIPASRTIALSPVRLPIAVETVHARIDVHGQSARTALDVVLRNPGTERQEAILLLPVPRGAAVSSFLFDGSAPEPTAKILPRDEARRLYEAIVQKLRDPALLEFAAHDLLRSSVFPVEPGATQRMVVTYEHLLTAENGRVDYELPRTDSLAHAARWDVLMRVRADRPLATIWSPTHEVKVTRSGADTASLHLTGEAARAPGAFRATWLLDRKDGLAASVLAFPDAEDGGGWLLVLAGLPRTDPTARPFVQREVTLVLDRSGSMAGKKLEQARAAVIQIVDGLADGEAFNLIDYASDVASFAAAPVRKDATTAAALRTYVAGLSAAGGTNLCEALLQALRPEPTPGTLPLVFFLTDGLPTIGRTSESWIRTAAEERNRHGRRVFTFGIGEDVNAPLLDRVAERTRAKSTYVRTGKDLEHTVARAFAETHGPVFSDLRLVARSADGATDTQRLRALEPAALPDLFEDDQLVVLGRYTGDEKLALRIEGRAFGSERAFDLELDPRAASTRHAYVPRLWASRRIATLIDQVRQAGADLRADGDAFADARLGEARQEILALSTRFGILSEYTAFLATEGTELADWRSNVLRCGSELRDKAITVRTGQHALSQAANLAYAKTQSALNPRNWMLDSSFERRDFETVQQVADRAFFRRGKVWIDGCAVNAHKLVPDEEVAIGSPRYLDLVERLRREGREGLLGLGGEVLIHLDGKTILIRDDGC
jgi:Ca-activated chloride channel family protein